MLPKQAMLTGTSAQPEVFKGWKKKLSFEKLLPKASFSAAELPPRRAASRGRCPLPQGPSLVPGDALAVRFGRFFLPVLIVQHLVFYFCSSLYFSLLGGGGISEGGV